MKLHSWILLVAAPAVAILFCGCPHKPSVKEPEEIKIGLAGPLTGPNGAEGSSYLHGAELAIDEWNENGGILGKKIVAVIGDDEGRPEKAVSVAQNLVDQGVVGVVGHYNNGCTLPASNIYAQHKIVQITISNDQAITERGLDTLFRLAWRNDQEGPYLAKYVKYKLGLNKLAVLYDKSGYGESFADAIKKSFADAGGQVVLNTGVNSTELDFRSDITQIKSSGAQAVFWGGMYNQAGLLLRQVRDAGLKIPFVSGSGTIAQPFLDAIGSHVGGVFFSFAPDYKLIPSAQLFLKTYRKKFGPEGSHAIYGYDSANILLRAIQQASSTDGDRIAEAMREQPFNSTLGPVDFDDKGDQRDPHLVMWTVKNGSFAVLPEAQQEHDAELR
jgi:branched-chain amino acid transport system substrate-binding protein